jgi:NTE family protein
MRGAIHLGALKALQEAQGSLTFPNGIYGSSVGAIGAALVAFNISAETIESVFKKYHTRSAWLPASWLGHAWSITSRKGVFPMDMLRNTLVSMFADCGIKDIETKKISDTPQPLFIIASNMTTRRAAILTGEVPLLQALLCSCCVPGLFEPQVLYGDVYLDAFVYTRRVEHIVPPGTLVLVLRDAEEKITPKSSLSDILFACVVGNTKSHDSIDVCYFKNIAVGMLDEVTDAQREELIQQGYSQTLAFLSKMAAKEGK